MPKRRSPPPRHNFSGESTYDKRRHSVYLSAEGERALADLIEYLPEGTGKSEIFERALVVWRDLRAREAGVPAESDDEFVTRMATKERDRRLEVGKRLRDGKTT